MGNVYLRVLVFVCVSIFFSGHALAGIDYCAGLMATTQEAQIAAASGDPGAAAAAAAARAKFDACKETQEKFKQEASAELAATDAATGEVTRAISGAQDTGAGVDSAENLKAVQPVAEAGVASAERANAAAAAADSMEKEMADAAAGAPSVNTGYEPDPEPKELLDKSNKAVPESKAVKGSLGKALVPLMALAAGVAGGMMMSKGDDKEEPVEEKKKNDETAQVKPEKVKPEACVANTVLQGGICVVKSADDKCYAADGVTVDKTRLRDGQGVCVLKNQLCETGYSYNDAEKVCKKSNCQEGFAENSSGTCVAINNTGGGTIGLPAPDPIFGDTPETEEEETDENAEANDPSQIQNPGSLGGNSSSAGTGRGAASFQTGRQGSAASGAAGSAYSAGGGASRTDKDATAGKDAQVQYQPLKWTNPKKTKSLREVISER